MCFRAPFMDGVAFHDPMHEATKKPLTTVAACHCSPYSPGRQSRPHLFHVVRKVCTKSGHVSTIPPVVKNNSHHGISTIKSDYPKSGDHRQKPKGFSCRLFRKRSVQVSTRRFFWESFLTICSETLSPIQHPEPCKFLKLRMALL